MRKASAIIAILLYTVLLVSCSKVDSSDYIILKEIKTPRLHYRVVEENDRTLILNMLTNNKEAYGVHYSEVLKLELEISTESFGLDTFVNRLNPESIKNTYANDKDFKNALSALLNKEHTILYLVRDDYFTDVVMTVDNEKVRIVVFRDKVKIFRNFNENNVNFLTYINETVESIEKEGN